MAIRGTYNIIRGTTWEFLRAGWWLLHIIAVVLVAYLGFLFWPR
ncbi:MAG: hypothetical protein AB1497_11020 [Bacillota bacterium]